MPEKLCSRSVYGLNPEEHHRTRPLVTGPNLYALSARSSLVVDFQLAVLPAAASGYVAASTNMPPDPDMPTTSLRRRDAPAGQRVHPGRQRPLHSPSLPATDPRGVTPSRVKSHLRSRAAPDQRWRRRQEGNGGRPGRPRS